jgi:hypothetical protein
MLTILYGTIADITIAQIARLAVGFAKTETVLPKFVLVGSLKRKPSAMLPHVWQSRFIYDALHYHVFVSASIVGCFRYHGSSGQFRGHALDDLDAFDVHFVIVLIFALLPSR